MRRSYISPEYTKLNVYGTYNMVEESNFFSAKMIDIENDIYIQKQDVVYYQNLIGEQLDISVESSIGSYVFSSINSKLDNHTLVIDETQSEFQRNKNTKWILQVDLKSILSNYIFASIKKARSFDGVKENMTRYDNVNVAIERYIEFNILDRYKLSELELFIQYRSLRNQSILRFKNDWNPNIELEVNRFKKLQTETNIDGSSIKILFNQEQESTQFSYEYFYNLSFVKI
jgi:hypothetical protein